MSHGDELFSPREDKTSRPSFVAALRGYDKRQVDEYVWKVDSELATLLTERDRALGRIEHLSAHLKQVQTELTDLRQQPPRVDRASFRDLGPTVDQILALAEKQATEITDAAGQRAAEQRDEAEKVLTEAWHRAERLRADSEAAHERAEQEAKRINEQCIQQAEDARAEAAALLEAAQAQTQQEVEARNEALTQLQGMLDTTQQQLTQSRQEGAAAEREVNQLRHRFDEVNQQLETELNRLEEVKRAAQSAERHAVDVRARVQREAERVAQLAAAAVMAAAARGAETGEYPIVVPPRPGANGLPGPTAGEATEPAGGPVIAQQAAPPSGVAADAE
jgi:cell division septum initiation protein DivIVA